MSGYCEREGIFCSMRLCGRTYGRDKPLLRCDVLECALARPPADLTRLSGRISNIGGHAQWHDIRNPAAECHSIQRRTSVERAALHRLRASHCLAIRSLGLWELGGLRTDTTTSGFPGDMIWYPVRLDLFSPLTALIDCAARRPQESPNLGVTSPITSAKVAFNTDMDDEPSLTTGSR